MNEITSYGGNFRGKSGRDWTLSSDTNLQWYDRGESQFSTFSHNNQSPQIESAQIHKEISQITCPIA